jgi:hypothetical protein
MVIIKGQHDLLGKTDAPAPDNGVAKSPRSKYCYLFHDAADLPEAGKFTGMHEQATIDHLKKFENDFIGLRNKDPAFLMRLPAAYTYFGQFLNHDISAPMLNAKDAPPGVIGTADPPGLDKKWRADNCDEILNRFVNEHADPMMLGSLYGDGPKDREVAAFYQPDRKSFCLGVTDPEGFIDPKANPGVVHATGAPDIPRALGIPLIADQRNDGNLILSQLHLAFMLVHNKAVKALEEKYPDPAKCFDRARELVTLHYHWLILNDFLPNLLSKSVLAKPLSKWPSRLAKADANADATTKPVPMEFTTAAFRFGHSMVGRSYDFNANFGHGGKISDEAKLEDLLAFTSKGKMKQPGPNALQLPDHWVIDWDRMTLPPKPALADEDALGGAEKIDLSLTNVMLNAAGDATVDGHGSIVFRNLLRGFHRRIPFGQVLAKACGVDPGNLERALAAKLAEPDVVFAEFYGMIQQYGMHEDTPAWLYFLLEAQLLEQGERVGPTASQIIADTIVGLMLQNPASVLRHNGGNWHPRDSVLKGKDDKPLDNLRSFLLFASHGP